MATPRAKRLRRFFTADAVSQILMDTDEDSNIPYGSDDENLTDNEDEFIADSDTDESDGDGDDQENDTDQGVQSLSPSSSTASPAAPAIWHWVKKDLPDHVMQENHLIPKGPALNTKTPLTMFTAHFDDGIIDLLLLETNRQRLVLNRTNMSAVTVEDMRVFLGIILYMTIVELPFRRMYWSPGTRQALIAGAMTCNRFEEILSVLHVNDNELSKERGQPGFDRLQKVRPLIDQLNTNFQNCAHKEQCIAVDEQIIPFKGRHGLKVYMMKKPTKWGYKVWVHAGQSGYDHKFIFAGDNVSTLNSNISIIPGIGKAGQVVLDLSEDQPADSYVFFDNYFASPDLLWELKKRKLNATCTIRSNRSRKCPVLCQKDLKKGGRGSFDHRLDE